MTEKWFLTLRKTKCDNICVNDWRLSSKPELNSLVIASLRILYIPTFVSASSCGQKFSGDAILSFQMLIYLINIIRCVVNVIKLMPDIESTPINYIPWHNV